MINIISIFSGYINDYLLNLIFKKFSKNNPYFIFDLVLSKLNIETTMSEKMIISDLKSVTISNSKISYILDTLVKEGYVDESVVSDKSVKPILINKLNILDEPIYSYPTISCYNLTFEGELLIENGGYSKKKKREIAELDRKRLYDKIVLWGAIFAGGFAIFNIIKIFLELWFRYDFYNPFN